MNGRFQPMPLAMFRVSQWTRNNFEKIHFVKYLKKCLQFTVAPCIQYNEYMKLVLVNMFYSFFGCKIQSRLDIQELVLKTNIKILYHICIRHATKDGKHFYNGIQIQNFLPFCAFLHFRVFLITYKKVLRTVSAEWFQNETS